MIITEKDFETEVEQMLLSCGWTRGDGKTFDRELALDTATLFKFIRTTQSQQWQRLCKLLGDEATKVFVQEFCAHIERTGIIQTLRDGFDVRGCKFRAVYWRPETAVNPELVERYGQNILTCVRQLHYSAQNQKSLDVVLFVNGLPLVTVELKNLLTGQNVDDAINQYKRDRDPSEKIFRFNQRAVIHFAADNRRAAVTTKLEGADTKFLPFNQGSNGAGKVGGAGNPSTTAYLWREILCKDTLLELLQKYLLVDGERIIFPRYHQLDAVTKLLAHVRAHGTGQNYLIQHSAGSGKSNSIAWLAHRLASLHDAADKKIFNSVLVVTDRRVLDRQLQQTVTQFEQVPGLVVKVSTSAELRDALNDGKKIIVTTLQKFPVIFSEVRAANKKFAIIVDEAHSSQTGSSARKMKRSLTDTEKVLAAETFLNENDRAYIDGLKRYVDNIAEIQSEIEDLKAEIEDAEFDRLRSQRIIAREFRKAILQDKDANAYIKRLNLPPDELEEFLAEYALAKFKTSKAGVITFSRAELKAFFNEYMSRKNSTEVKADDSFTELKANVDAQIYDIKSLAWAAYEESNLPDAEDELLAEVASHGRQENLSFFAFTATPKPRTLEIFGTQNDSGGREPFHIYSMRQAIDEGFILDVLKNYVTYETFFRIGKNSPENPLVDKSRAVSDIKKFVSLHPHAIAAKTVIIMNQFVTNTQHKIGGRAKAMVVTSSRLHAVRYFFAIKRYIESAKLSGVNVLIAFSGLVEDGGNIYSESSLNGFPESRLKENFHGDGYNILVVAEKYQTGFDEPLLHTMFVDKKLDGVKAVQTLSRLNRTCTGKFDTFILDFVNDADTIRKSFLPFYETTILTADTDPAIVYELKKKLDGFEIYDSDDISAVIGIFFAEGKRTSERVFKLLQRPLDKFSARDEESQSTFRKTLKQFNRLWSTIVQINRLFDENLQHFALFAELFAKVLPSRNVSAAEIQKMLELEFYRAQETFSGTIELAPEENVIEFAPPKVSEVAGNRVENPLNKILREINATYGTNFTSGDRVFAGILRGFLTDSRALTCAKQNNATMFRTMIYGELFREKILLGLTVDPALDEFVARNEKIIPWIGEEIFPTVYAALKED